MRLALAAALLTTIVAHGTAHAEDGSTDADPAVVLDEGQDVGSSMPEPGAADNGAVSAGGGTSQPAPGAILQRVACIESKESGGANVANRSGSGAGGVLQYMEPTFRAHAREMGHPEWSRWNPDEARAVAAHDLLLGRRKQWTVNGC